MHRHRKAEDRQKGRIDPEGSDHAGHRHDHTPPKDFSGAFRLGILLNLVYVAIEGAFGLITGSLALLADAGHNLSDVLGLALAWGAALLAKRPSTLRRTFGLRRGTILAALLNALLLLIAVGGIAWEAIRRLLGDDHAHGLDGTTVIWVAGAGVVINALTALLFMRGQKEDLNVRGAFLHMAADALVSLGVVAAGLVILGTGWETIDPIISILIVVVITWSTWGLLRESFNLAVDAVPQGIDPEEVGAYLDRLDGITEYHHLHIWGMSTTEAAMTVHLVKPDPEGDDRMLRKICHDLAEEFGIDHVTVQWERGEFRCEDETG